MKKIFKAMLFACLTFTSLVGCDTKDEKGTNNGDNNSTENKVEAKLTGITLDTTNVKKAYTYGETLDLTGLVVNGSYDDNTSKAVTGYTTNPANGAALNSVGDVPVTVTYEEKTASFNVTVGKTLTGITLETTNAKKAYTYGDALDVTGLVVKANYNDNSSEAISDYTVSPTAGTTLTTAGDNTVTVTYSGLTETYKVTVDKTPTGIELDTANVKKDYIYGDKFTSAGLGVSAVYANGVKEAISSGYTVSVDDNTDLLTGGNQDVTVTYGTLTSKYTINVDKTATSITANANNVKQNYKVGEKLDLTGLVVTANYSNGYSEEIDTYTTSTEDKATLSTGGEFDLVVSYGTLTDSFKVTVTKAPATMDVDTTKAKMSYNRGDELNLSKIEVKIIYDDGTSEVVKNYNQSISNGTVLTSDTGSQDVVITYGNLTKTLTVQVDKGIIYLDQSSVKGDYSYGDTLDLDGIRFYNEFSDGTKKYVDVLSTDPVDGTVLNSVGWIYIKANYIDVVGVEALVSVGFYVKALNETSTHLTLNLDESPTQLYGRDYDSKKAVGTPGSNYTPEFRFYEGTPNSNSFEIVNGKMRIMKDDVIESNDLVGGITSVRVNGGNGYYKFFAGYRRDTMYEFVEPESGEGTGDRIFNNLPNVNYFKIVGKYNDDPAYISSIEIEYTRDEQHNMIAGEATDISTLTVNNGSYMKNKSELKVNSDKVELGGDTYNYAGIVYEGSLVYSNDSGRCILVKFVDVNTVQVKDALTSTTSINGTYSKVITATAITMYVDSVETAANYQSNRIVLPYGSRFSFSATCDAVPVETVSVELVDESLASIYPYAGTYTPKQALTMQDYGYVLNNGYQFDVTIDYIVLGYDASGALSEAMYKDHSACDEYPGHDDVYDNVELKNGVVSFGDDNFEVTLDMSTLNVSLSYTDDDYGITAYGLNSMRCEFEADYPSVANINNGVVTATSDGNFHLVCRTSNNIVSNLYFTVLPYVKASMITFVNDTAANMSINKGEEKQLYCATNDDATNRTLKFSSDNTSVATVNDNGIVKGVKGGTAKITVSTADGISRTINMTVRDNSSTTTYTLRGTYSFTDTYDLNHDIVFSADGAVMDYGFEFTLTDGKYVYDYNNGAYFTIEKEDDQYVIHYYDEPVVLVGTGFYADTTEGTFPIFIA